jgi:hypothetical protein
MSVVRAGTQSKLRRAKHRHFWVARSHSIAKAKNAQSSCLVFLFRRSARNRAWSTEMTEKSGPCAQPDYRVVDNVEPERRMGIVNFHDSFLQAYGVARSSYAQLEHFRFSLNRTGQRSAAFLEEKPGWVRSLLSTRSENAVVVASQ